MGKYRSNLLNNGESQPFAEAAQPALQGYVEVTFFEAAEPIREIGSTGVFCGAQSRAFHTLRKGR